jgi:hypothetical protein
MDLAATHPLLRLTGTTLARTTLTRTSVALGVALLLALLATPAHAHGDGDHTHGGISGFEDADFLDPIIWDGSSSVDCRVAGEGTIVWLLTGSDGVEYAELHIDEPESTVTARTGGPYVWISPLYPLDAIEADVDRIVGVLADDARLDAVTCPEGGEGRAAGLAVPVGGGIVVGGVLGLLVGSRRRSA